MAPNTLKHYNGYLERFRAFALGRGFGDWRLASLPLILDFLCSLVTERVERPSSVLDMAIPALRLAFPGSDLMDSPWIPRLRKGLVTAHTARPRRVTEPIPAEPVCAWLRGLPDNDRLSLVELRRKVAVLAAMVLIARPSDLTRILPDSLVIRRDGAEMSVDLLAFKNDYQRDGSSLVVMACSEPRLCFIRAASALLARLRRAYSRPVALFLHEQRNEALLPASVGRILKEACTLAGIGDAFSGRNFRPGGATRGLAAGLPLDLVMHIGRWRDPSTVFGHYVRSAQPPGTSDALLGVRPSLDAT